MVSKTLTAICGWMLGGESLDRGETNGRQRTDAFFADLAMITHRAASVTHSFCDENNQPIGNIQLHRSGGEVMIHRIWTLQPGQGQGSKILSKVCELADRHGVVIRLKVAPLGAKPYPMSAGQLEDWYRRHGFVGEKKLVRFPASRSRTLCSTPD